ncbi:hypothetical protein PC120_g6527 [Phytophthora cactorum]|nr:hypothetical protein PC120_g6527 [Phytophthora cactorum]
MLHEDGEVMDDQHLADVLLSNAAEVYPGLAREHGERKRATRSKPELRDATALRRCRQRVRQDLDLLVTVSVDGAALARGLGALVRRPLAPTRNRGRGCAFGATPTNTSFVIAPCLLIRTDLVLDEALRR